MRMGLRVVMVNVRKILTGDIQQIRMIVVADREHDMATVPDAPYSARGLRFNRKEGRSGPVLGLCTHTADFFFEHNPQIECVDDLAVVLQRLGPGWLLERRDKGNPAYLQKLRRREEHHLRWKVINRV